MIEATRSRERDMAKAMAAKLFNASSTWPDNGYVPMGQAAVAFYDTTSTELLISGPARTGKSRGLLEKIHRTMLQYAGARSLMVRKTRESLSETALQTFEDHVLGEGHPLLLGVGGRTLERKNRTAYIYPNRSRIVVGGMDKPTKILSSEYDLIFVQEAIELTLEDWESLVTRLSNYVVPYQQLMGDTNPDSELHWLFQRCQEGTTRMLKASHEDNPVLYDQATKSWTVRGVDYIQNKLDKLTGIRYERFRHGRWATAEGAVYEDYSPAIHLIDRFNIPDHWRRFRVVDYGYTNPFVCQWWAVDPDGRMYRYREIYHTKRTVRQHAEQIKALSEGEIIEATITDHDAEDNATMRENGIPTTNATKRIKQGIEKVTDRLAVAGDEKPRIFFLRDSLVELDLDLVEAKLPTCTEEEIPSYVYPKGQDGKPKKELPVDLNNHGCDATRYAVEYEDGDKRGPGARQMKAKFVTRRRR